MKIALAVLFCIQSSNAQSVFDHYQASSMAIDHQIKINQRHHTNEGQTLATSKEAHRLSEIFQILSSSDEDYQAYLEQHYGTKTKGLKKFTKKISAEISTGTRRYGYSFAIMFFLGEVIEFGLPPLLVVFGVPQFVPLVYLIPQGTILTGGAIGINSLKTRRNRVKAFESRDEFIQWKNDNRRVAQKKMNYETSDQTHQIKIVSSYQFSNLLRSIGFEKNKLHLQSIVKFAKNKNIDPKIIKRIKKLHMLNEQTKATLLLEYVLMISAKNGQENIFEELSLKFAGHITQHKPSEVMIDSEVLNWLSSAYSVHTEENFNEFCRSIPNNQSTGLIASLWLAISQQILTENQRDVSINAFRKWSAFVERTALPKIQNTTGLWLDTDTRQFCDESSRLLFGT